MTPKLDFGAVFDRTFDIYKNHFKTLVLAALAVFAVVFVMTVVLVMVAFKSAGAAVFAVFVLGCLAAIAMFFYQGMVIRVVQHHGEGREHSLSELFDSVKPVMVPLIFTSILAAIFTFIGFIFLIVPGLILMAHFAVVSAIVVVERVNYMDALKRSWAMVKGNAWTVFGVIVVLNIALFIVRGVLGTIGTGIGHEVGRSLFELVANVLVAPLPAIAAAVMFFMLGGAGAPATGAPAPAAPAAPTGLPGTGATVAGSKPPPPPPPAA